MDLEYVAPTYRLCQVYGILSELSFDQSNSVRQTFIRNYSNKCKENGETSSSDYCSEELSSCEGPLIAIPEFEHVEERKPNLAIRVSCTVCIAPHHSKIWVRISQDKARCKKEEQFDVCDLHKFFEDANRLSLKYAEIFALHYSDSLAEHGILDQLTPVHNIIIETAACDLRKMLGSLEKSSFRMKEFLQTETQTKTVPGFLNEVYESNLNSKWIILKFCLTGKQDIAGVYIKQNRDRETKFSGLVDPMQYSKKQSGWVTQEFSKKLVQQFASRF